MAAEIKITPELLASLVQNEVAKLMSAKTPDERIAEAMALQRGTNRPPRKEDFADCVSPVTKATFRARLELLTNGTWGVTELLDYKRPDGWNVLVRDGGLGNSAQLHKDDRGEYTQQAIWLQQRAYWILDNAMVGSDENGRRALPKGWSAEYDRRRSGAEDGSVTISREEYETLLSDATSYKESAGSDPA